jgi:hypothetical protein
MGVVHAGGAWVTNTNVATRRSSGSWNRRQSSSLLRRTLALPTAFSAEIATRRKYRCSPMAHYSSCRSTLRVDKAAKGRMPTTGLCCMPFTRRRKTRRSGLAAAPEGGRRRSAGCQDEVSLVTLRGDLNLGHQAPVTAAEFACWERHAPQNGADRLQSAMSSPRVTPVVRQSKTGCGRSNF